MKTVVLLGTGPLPIENESYSFGSSSRTWHLSKGLLDAGHKVHTLAFRPLRVKDGEETSDPEIRTYSEGNFFFESVDGVRHFYDDDFLMGRIREIAPDALVGVNLFPASRAAFLAMELPPFWADLHGYHMAEVQIRSRITGDDSAVTQAWREVNQTIRRADAFSVTSRRQRYALIGELGGVGRLRGATCDHEFVHHLPIGREDFSASRNDERTAPIREELGEEAVLALWVGGYNFHFDTDALFEGLEAAFEEAPNLHFISTGGAIEGHHESSFERFVEKANKSRHNDRFHFVGWLPQEEFERLLGSCDLGVSMDRACYETEIGARNRITEMTRAGLPAVTTEGPEIAEEIAQNEAGWTFPTGDRRGLARCLVEASESPGERARRGKNGRDLFLREFTYEASLRPLLEWVENPKVAPDRGMAPLVPDPFILLSELEAERERAGILRRVKRKLFG